MGRPSNYSQEIVGAICERLANGESLRKICADDDMPAISSVFQWLSLHKEFAEQYARAREVQADTLFDEILEIADNGLNDTYTDEQGNVRTDQDVIARSRLRVDSRKWMAGKLRPKVYGDKLALGGADDLPPIAVVSRVELVALDDSQN
ncbi:MULTISPECIES: terminase small subunit protein [unclassified Polaromonas]|jgi:hypothetical protein|uniref:terminase small subunit-like protein n=1 Tax=unclassified Polaromonas TaxID=2638319 RepID=UPI000BCA3B22|nr:MULTISPECIES: terminase small subunit protein [unclassified Polaromonas]OYY34775.1 MAG: hypothetical protein B7Y60_15160 [Polaromonas sp. 35-63-35]OYZ19338.1 MAG: hypothetical protein B7Y28_12430 [Polaromonas sp. 16-63-31]OYZ77536.1 MAG: hypothetical protein B7Y09_16320 [Polaromonas sp. 24-63-21]OZA48481.1 MAG: hypothetical protein B7X88_18200 [Polaromonas sp. 17-63-33]OZA87229.1 MAG: hypothetical protein B7X65_13670 [Polaromonas sp. 39-63-25]